MNKIEIVTRTVEVRGIMLPWERKERYGCELLLHAGQPVYPDRQPTGTVIESGEVFVTLEDLEAVVEQDPWDSEFGSALLLGYHEGMALEKAGFAVQETRGGYHGTDKLLGWMKENGLR